MDTPETQQQSSETYEEGTTQAAPTNVQEVTTEEGVVQRHIKAENPSPEEMKELLEHINVNYDFDVDVKNTRFNFKKTKDKESGIETVREAVDLAIPYPSVNGILTILKTGGKQLELLQSAVEDVVNSVARELLYEDTSLTAATFPVDKISWDAISKIPRAQRRGGGIPKETWEEFAQDYISVMPAATGKSVDQVTNATKIYMNKLNTVKTSIDVLEYLVGQLALYVEATENIDDYRECVDFLVNKAETYLKTTPEELLANL